MRAKTHKECRSRESFHGFRSCKVQKGQRPTRSAEVKESFEDSKRTKLRRESAFMHRALQVITEAERRPFGGFEFAEAQEGR
jgi:hypothetical protein